MVMGLLIIHSQYLPVIKEQITGRRNGSLVSSDNGRVTTYSIMHLEDRGTIFVRARY